MVLSLILSLLPAVALAEPPAPSPTPAPEDTAPAAASSSVTVSSDSDALSKLSPDLRVAAAEGGSAQMRVIVFAAPGAEFAGLLDHPLPGAAEIAGLQMISGLTTNSKLLKLAGLPGVQAVVNTGGAVIPPPPQDTPPRPALDRSSRPEPALPPLPAGVAPSSELNMWHARDVVKAAQANALGYDGNGVIVSVNDTGVDFAHPDLQGTQARDRNPNSPYFGWPLVADDDSIFTYLVNNSASSTRYSDTSATFTLSGRISHRCCRHFQRCARPYGCLLQHQ